MSPRLPDVFHCNFCAKSQHEVLVMIAAPTVCICNECVDLCADIIQQRHGAQLDEIRRLGT